MQFHVAIADNVPGSPSGEYTVTAGQTATFTIDSPGPDDLYTEGTAVPLLNGGYVRWAYVDNVLPNSLTVTLSPPASVQAGGYTLDVNLCGCFFNTSERGGGNGDICEVVAPLDVAAAEPELTIGLTSNIAVLSPAQAITAAVTVSGASGTVTITVSPAGRASVSPASFTLVDGGSQQVTVTPLQVSQSVGDVQIIASLGQLSASANLTIVNIVIPTVTNADTPSGMPNRIPPTATTQIQVTVQPNLTGSPFNIVVAKLNNNTTNGDFTIAGGASQTITTTTTVNLVGTTQTAPTTGGTGGGNAGHLNLVAQLLGQNVVTSTGFSVAAIPLNFTDAYLATYTNASPLTLNGVAYIGISVQDGWASDSGSVTDLGSVNIEEQVQAGQGTGVFAQFGIGVPAPTYNSATSFTADVHLAPGWFLTGTGAGVPNGFQPATGTLPFSQVHIFQDFRTGANNIPMANSGFTITQQITVDGSGTFHLTTSKAGAVATANGYTSTAGSATPNTGTPNLITVTKP